jgi:hypothetical protein
VPGVDGSQRGSDVTFVNRVHDDVSSLPAVARRDLPNRHERLGVPRGEDPITGLGALDGPQETDVDVVAHPLSDTPAIRAGSTRRHRRSGPPADRALITP